MNTEQLKPDPRQLRFNPYSSYYSNFFVLKTSVSINGQPAVIEYSTGDLTLNCRYPKVCVPFRTISSDFEDILKSNGVSHVGHFFCEDAPLYQISFTSADALVQFLRQSQRLQRELNSFLQEAFSDAHATNTSEGTATARDPLATEVQIHVLLISPDVVNKDARIVNVTLDNCVSCMALWKESEVFEFGSLFRIFRQHMDPNKPNDMGGAITVKDLLDELKEVTEWFYLGIHLECALSDLREIRYKHETTRDLTLTKVDLFTKWLRVCSHPSWSHIVRALVGIGEQALAEKLGTKYGVFVPPRKHVTPPWHLYTVSFEQGFQHSIQEAQSNFESTKQKMAEKCHSLEVGEKARSAASDRLQSTKQSLQPYYSKLRKLRQKKRRQLRKQTQEERELHYLQLLLNKEQKGNEGLATTIKNKEEEIERLQKSLEALEAEVKIAKEELENMRGELHTAIKDLEIRSFQVLELEKARNELKHSLEQERRNMLLLCQSALSPRMKHCSAEMELLAARNEPGSSSSAETELQHQLEEKDVVIATLREKEKISRTQLQRLTKEEHDEIEEMQVDELLETVTVLGVQLQEARLAKEEVERGMTEIKESEQWVKELEEITAVDPGKCQAVGLGAAVGEVGKTSSFDVHLVCASGDPCTTCTLQQLTVNVMPEPATISVDSKSPAVFEVSYLPIFRGQHKLCVEVNGEPIHGSPFQVCVKQSRYLLSNCEPVDVAKGLQSPMHIAIGANSIVVSEAKKLSIYSKEGHAMRSISTVRIHEKIHTLSPSGVAIDGNGTIYVADLEFHGVFKLNPSLKAEKATEQRSFLEPKGLALSQDDTRLFVCDLQNHKIQVLDSELTVLGSIVGSGVVEGVFPAFPGQLIQYPVDVACDVHGNVYVVDSWYDCVHVLLGNGTHQRTVTFNNNRSQCGGCIHVDRDFLYISVRNMHLVLVYSVASGEYITSIGQRNLMFPWGIATDEDGFIFVCENYRPGNIKRF